MTSMNDAHKRIRRAAAQSRRDEVQAERQRREENERHQEMEKRRERLLADAKSALAPFKSALLEGIKQQGPEETGRIVSHDSVCLHGVELSVSVPGRTDGFPSQWAAKLFNVVATSHVVLGKAEQEPFMAASLWYCDAEREGEYGWYQIAFATSDAVGGGSPVEPFGLDPSKEDACLALSAMHTVVPRSFEVVDDDTFTTRWATLFADALEGKLYERALDQWPNKQCELVWRRGDARS